MSEKQIVKVKEEFSMADKVEVDVLFRNKKK